VSIQPRQQILELWQSVVRSSFRDGEWHWGGRAGSNSIADAEQLLCLIFPAAELPGFRLDDPDRTAEDVLETLASLGDAVAIPKLLVRLSGDYLRKYTAEDGRSVFSGGSYFTTVDPDAKLTDEQRDLDIVDSLSLSVSLMLGILGFIKVFRRKVTQQTLLRELAEVEGMAGRRLSAAMVGLLRSFTINAFSADSDAGRALIGSVNQVGAPDDRIRQELRDQLEEVRAGLRDITIGSGSEEDIDWDNAKLLFECGWSWGIVKDAPAVETDEPVGPQPTGLAQKTPFMYFSFVSLFGIQDLFSTRTRTLGLLNDEQVRLSEALERRWNMVLTYWSTIATYGRGRWPVEDIPWRTSDGKESDYYTLCVMAMVVQNLISNEAAGIDLTRVTGVLEELAIRGRVNRRAIAGDPPIALHSPGVDIKLRGSEDAGGPRAQWVVSDFAITLLKRTIWVAGKATTTTLRNRLLDLADDLWEHLLQRRASKGLASGLWDYPENVFPGVDLRFDLPSWYYTERVVEFLVLAARSVEGAPLQSPNLTSVAWEMLTEAEFILNQELLVHSVDSGPSLHTALRSTEAQLRRARDLIEERPGTAHALVADALRALDGLAAARQDAKKAG
jgi:hypothetical protein